MKKISFRNDVLPLKDILYRLALRITLNSAEAEDIVQDTLVKVWSRRDDWDEIESIEAFCLTICKNLSIDRTKKAAHYAEAPVSVAEEKPDSSSSPYEQTLRNDRMALVRLLVDSLPEKQRCCMQLRDFEGKSYKDIAGILGISEEQVKINIFRARQAIKTKFKNIEDYGL